MATLKKLTPEAEKTKGTKTAKLIKPSKKEKTAKEPVEMPTTIKIGKRNVKVAELKRSAQKDAKYFTNHDPKDNPGRWKYLIRSAVRSGQLPEAEAAALVE